MGKSNSRSQVVIRGGDIFTPKLRKKLIKGGTIVLKGDKIHKVLEKDSGNGPGPRMATVIDAKGKLVIPGLINCHGHLYSTLARGMGMPGQSPQNFRQCLERVWWRLDKALTYEDCYWSSLLGSLLTLKCGVTTLIDHHASPYSIDGSLDAVAKGMMDAGIRGSVCYEVSDRDGLNRASEGISENVRFADSLGKAMARKIRPMMGLHASFTISEPTLFKAGEAAAKHNMGFHLHVAEDLCDVRDSQRCYRKRVVRRLFDAGILSKKTLAIHCVHVNDSEIALLAETGANVINCPRSNLGNAVGISPVGKMFRHGVRVGLGSDGFGYSIFDDALTALLSWRLREGLPSTGGVETELMLFNNNPTIASGLFERKMGEIAEGYAADVVVLSYDSPTPVNRDNLYFHLLSGEAMVDTVIADGRVVVRDGRSTLLDEEKVFAKAREVAQSLWERI